VKHYAVALDACRFPCQAEKRFASHEQVNLLHNHFTNQIISRISGTPDNLFIHFPALKRVQPKKRRDDDLKVAIEKEKNCNSIH